MSYVAAPALARCVGCGGALRATALSRARYCSSACRQSAYRARRRAERERIAAEQAARIPAELTGRHRWVRHAAKRPLRLDGKYASTIDASTWADFAAVASSQVGEGLGFVLAPGDGIVVVDLDHAVDDGRVRPWAARIIEHLPTTYMERGRSGTGLHLWFRGEALAGRRIRRGDVAIEVYSDRRYIIVGDRVPGTPLSLAELPDAAGVIASLV
jgi:primase-polymerase (primpol)-like protein